MKNHIFLLDDYVESDKCEQIIKWFEEDTDRHIPGGVGPGIVDRRIKASTDLPCDVRHKTCKYSDILLPLLCGAMIRYTDEYPYLLDMAPWGLTNVYNIQKYVDGEGFFKLHCEAQIALNINRIVAWTLYLNDAASGTEYPTQDTVVEAKQGRLALFPATWTHCHKGVTPNVGTKYIATGWYELVDGGQPKHCFTRD